MKFEKYLKKYDIEIYDIGFFKDNFKNINYGINYLIGWRNFTILK